MPSSLDYLREEVELKSLDRNTFDSRVMDVDRLFSSVKH